MFGSALLRRKGVRGFRFGIGWSGVIQITRDGRRQVGIERIGVGTVTVVIERIGVGTVTVVIIWPELDRNPQRMCVWTDLSRMD